MPDIDEIKSRTEARIEKYRDRANALRDDLSDARAATKVQMKAMIERLEEKIERAEERYDDLKSSSATTASDYQALLDELMDDWQSMIKTIRRRIR